MMILYPRVFMVDMVSSVSVDGMSKGLSECIAAAWMGLLDERGIG